MFGGNSPSMKMQRSIVSTLVLFLACASLCKADAKSSAPDLKIARFAGSSVEVVSGKDKQTLRVGNKVGDWTLMEIIDVPAPHHSYAVFEDWAHPDGHMIFVDAHGLSIDLPKSSESTSADPSTILRGHTPEQINESAPDLLGNEILAMPGDPEYDEVAKVFPPIRKIKTYSFVGTPDNNDKVGFVYGGRTPNFDPAPYYDPINKIRDEGKVLDGVVGGYLPILALRLSGDCGKLDGDDGLRAVASFRQ